MLEHLARDLRLPAFIRIEQGMVQVRIENDGSKEHENDAQQQRRSRRRPHGWCGRELNPAPPEAQHGQQAARQRCAGFNMPPAWSCAAMTDDLRYRQAALSGASQNFRLGEGALRLRQDLHQDRPPKRGHRGARTAFSNRHMEQQASAQVVKPGQRPPWQRLAPRRGSDAENGLILRQAYQFRQARQIVGACYQRDMAEPRLGCGQAQGTAIGQRIRRRNMAYACVVDARRLDGASPPAIVRRARNENLILEREPFQNTRGLTERGA